MKKSLNKKREREKIYLKTKNLVSLRECQGDAKLLFSANVYQTFFKVFNHDIRVNSRTGLGFK